MEVEIPSGGVKKHIEEWSRLDKLTGMLEHARIEADHWAANTSNGTHHFGKVVDSRAKNLADGSVQQKLQTKQLELFQGHIPGGSVQVIRSHTKTSSSWHSSKTIQNNLHTESKMTNGVKNSADDNFNDISFDRSMIDLSIEKTKANIARSLVNRRPPTRNSQSKVNGFENGVNDLSTETRRICDEIHKNTIESLSNFTSLPKIDSWPKEDKTSLRSIDSKKSTSEENLSAVDEPSGSSDWRRSAKTRWSLQYPKPKRDEGENCSEKSELQLVLEKVLRKRQAEDGDKDEKEDMIKPARLEHKKKSFVTEETLKETRNKLKHFSRMTEEEEADDGIGTRPASKEDIPVNKELSSGTGSLESRCNRSCGSNGKVKNEEWYNRRKSYGFEQVAQQSEIPLTAQKIDSSTDSGICRSAELFAPPRIDKRNTKMPINYGATTVVTLSSPTNSLSAKANLQVPTFQKEKLNSDLITVTLPSIHEDSSKQELKTSNTESKFPLPVEDYTPLKSPLSLKTLQSPVTVKNHSDTDQEMGQCEKKQKKVEFCKTEIHFAAEPGRINIVETDEKPPPNNLYRRRRKNSDASKYSPLPQTRFGDSIYERDLLSNNCISKLSGVDSASNEKEVNDALNNLGDTFQNESKLGPHSGSESVTTDNGLAVRISSKVTPLDTRRASWSVPDKSHVENKGYSTKINFGDQGATVVANPISNLPQRTRHSICGSSQSAWRTVYPSCIDNVKENSTCREKLIVRIGNGDVCSTNEYVQKPTFSYSFRNSLCNDLSIFTYLSQPSVHKNELKSTSLIIETIRNTDTAETVTRSNCISEKQNAKVTTNNTILKKPSRNITEIAARPNCISENRSKKVSDDSVEATILEQPSTYITEMNRLQQKYSQEVKTKLCNEKHVYNTIPVTRSAKYVMQNTTSVLPSVLSAFDTLSKQIDEVIENPPLRASSCKTVTTSQHVETALKNENSSSHFELLNNSSLLKDGNISDDSLKADEEVSSYMSAALEANRRKQPSLKHMTPLRIISKEDADKIEKLRNNKDIKKPVVKQSKTTAVTVGFARGPFRTQIQPTKSTTTILIGRSNENRSQSNSVTSLPEKQTNGKPKINIENPKTAKRNPTRIHVDPKKCSDSAKNGVRRKPMEDLYKSGRDGWLNIPKVQDHPKRIETKKVVSNRSSRNAGATKSEPRDDDSLITELTKAADEIFLAVKGYTDGESYLSSDEDAGLKTKATTRLTTIAEKVPSKFNGKAQYIKPVNRVRRLSSNSSIEDVTRRRSNMLRTEERSRRRAERLLRTGSNELLQNGATSSEDLGSENETSKVKPKFVKKSKMSSEKSTKLSSKPSHSLIFTDPSFSRNSSTFPVTKPTAAFINGETKQCRKNSNHSSTRSYGCCKGTDVSKAGKNYVVPLSARLLQANKKK